MVLFTVLSALLLIGSTSCQSTNDCGISYSCFNYPTGCSNNACQYIYKWRSNGNTLTDFVIAGKIGTLTYNWLAIGFSADQNMGNDDVVLCLAPYNIIQHYVNLIGIAPILMNSANPSVGLSNQAVNFNNSWLSCSFTRQLSLPAQQSYFDLSKIYYVLGSFGTISNGLLQYHGNNRVFSSSLNSFQFTPLTTLTTNQPSLPTGASSPPTGGSLPPTGGSMPQTGGSMPPTGGSLPPTGGSMPPTGSPPNGSYTGAQTTTMGQIIFNSKVKFNACPIIVLIMLVASIIMTTL